MYSQNDEEAHVLSAVAKRGGEGVFLDIGAHDGKTNSNTRALAELGWGGILVEAAPGNVSLLLELYGDRDDIAIVNAAIATHREHKKKFYDARTDGIGTLDPAQLHRWEASTKFRTFYVQTLPWSEFLATWPGPFNVVSIDLEGTSMDIFRLFPFEGRDTDVIIVEHDGAAVEASAIGKAHGFRVADVNPENVILVRR